MSDKSFGDHTVRNIMKNPLLSTAVTGLSIEDLTHHAVLLPVAQSQGEITRQDELVGAGAIRTLGHTDHSTPNLSSGDSNSNILALNIPLSNNRNTVPPQQSNQIHINNDLPTTTQSKVSIISDDDFDVNEYFARLHGTRYVSAPLQSLQKDQNANLEATEENLEEINLNEPEKPQNDEQQSLTADIAQNFSQLPTVLPQVASAVFSSFSNMLSLKSREVTPDEGKANTVPQQVHAQIVDVGAPLLTVPDSGIRELPPPPIALPPREPPVGGIGNYRIGTKKKAYAQIPGLSSGETLQRPFIPSQDHQTYGTPNTNLKATEQVQSVFAPNVNVSEFSNPQEIKAISYSSDNTAVDITRTIDQTDFSDVGQATSKDSYNIFNPVVTNTELKNENVLVSDNKINLSTKENVTNLFAATVHSPVETSQQSSHNINVYDQFKQNFINAQGSNSNQSSFSSATESSVPANAASIIPPPPMFSNLPRTDSQSTVGKSILPPSVARRIAGSQPVIKSQATQAAAYGNIFIPAPTSDLPAENSKTFKTPAPGVLMINQRATSQTNLSASLANSEAPVKFPPLANTSVPLFTPGNTPSSIFPSNSTTSSVNISLLPPSSSNISLRDIQSQTSVNDVSAPLTFTPTFSELPVHLSVDSNVSTLPTNLPPLPTLLDPSAAESVIQNSSNSEVVTENSQNKVSQFFAASTEPAKSIPEPPKLTASNTSFRMTKKRPQYYSGPIEGVSAISNSVKTVMPNSFFFTPQADIFDQNTLTNDKKATDQSAGASNTVAPPFDISRHPETTPFDLNKQEPNVQPDYNTAFDLSRETTERYEEPKQETKGFGLIGSLKSKLSSIDINKIQNSVTTFFDPAYNDTKKESSFAQETLAYGQQQSAAYNLTQTQSSNFEIFVPNTQQTLQCNDYQTSYQNQTPGYDYNQGNPYHQTQSTFNYYQHENSYPTYNYYRNDYTQSAERECNQSDLITTQKASKVSPNDSYCQDSFSKVSTDVKEQISNTVVSASKLQRDSESCLSTVTIAEAVKSDNEIQITNHIKPDVTAKSFFDQHWVSTTPTISKPDELNEEMSKLLLTEESQKQTKDKEITLNTIDSKDDNVQDASPTSVSNLLSAPVSDLTPKENILSRIPLDYHTPTTSSVEIKDVDVNQGISFIEFEDNKPTSDVSSVSLFGLSESVADKNNDSNDIEKTKLEGNHSSQEDLNDNLDSYDSTVSNFFNKGDSTYKDLEDEHGSLSDLNICETCREVNKPEEKELDNVTDQLIENITAPIQLLNPVEVPLNENNTLEENVDDFDNSQCAEISLVTEETIENIHMQTATEMLEDDDENNSNMRNYGWNTDTSFLSSKVSDLDSDCPPTVDMDSLASKVLLEQDYNFEPNVNSIGFFGNNASFFDNIPNNASDEIKAEFKHSHEDPPILVSQLSQMSIPSAPPAEDDDDNSDETDGLDVLSIEQDAKKDFPIFEEYVIEPSETDDDKMEFREREKSDDLPDTFTNRVEKFKKMEKSTSDIYEDVFDNQKGANWQRASPVITIASYFDTGNYAAETHYRNSLTSPSTITTFTATPMRIPPGFEEEYKRRLSCLLTEPDQKSLNNIDIVQIPECTTQTKVTTTLTFNAVDNIKTVPDTSTQTRPINTLTFSKVDSSKAEDIAIGSDPIIDLVQESDCVSLPEFSSVFSSIKRKEEEEKDKVNNQVPILSNIFGVKTEGAAEDVKPSLVSEHIELFQKLPELSSNPPELLLNADKRNQETEESTYHLFKIEKSDDFEKPKTDNNSLFTNLKPIETLENQNVTQALPDPINFFSKTSPNQESADVGYNRLASYFASPAKTEPSKPFFELSQSQNHYRHSRESNVFGTQVQSTHTKDHKNFFHVGQSENHYKDNISNIPQDKYLANFNLMRDLTSSDNLEIGIDQVIRTVNFFTVEYDDVIKTDLNKGEPETNNLKIYTQNPDYVKIDNELETSELETNELEAAETTNDETCDLLIKKCKYCCNLPGVAKCSLNFESVGDVKVRETMDYNSSEPKKEREANMCENKDNNRRSTTIDLENYASEKENEDVSMLSENRSSAEYAPVKHHWFYRVDCEGKSIWRGFSVEDSRALENAFHSSDLNENTLVPTDGGRYDVNIIGRLRTAVYWTDKPTNVRRCSWFYKGTTDARYVPYTEPIAEKLEEEYRHGITTGEWHRRLTLPNNEMVVMHGPGVMVHFLHGATTDAFSTPNQSTTRPRVVRRGIEESEIEDPEPSHIDHLLLLCHGVGSACDMRFRAVEEVVDDFRATSLQLLQSHYRNAYDNGVVSRVEVLPISWHATLHSGETGVDRRLALITLDSIPRLRSFTNDTVLDVLFYTSPIFCQTIIDTVCKELNRIYNLFKKRNPNFNGGVSLGGHSLGSVILYDLLCHQNAPNPADFLETNVIDDKKYLTGSAGTGQPSVKYPNLDFAPTALYALGSPIAIFECIRGVESLGMDFSLPTCKNFFNIFHPYDPIAYRIEPLINSQLKNLKPYLIPHHKGRKRMHLELKDTMARVGADIKQKLVESIKATWASMWRAQPPPNDQLEKVVEEEIEKEKQELEESKEESQVNDQVTPDMLGKLNSGRRVDYVLQEAPFEMINEYLFAMTSHVCYWESEDTMLLMLREIYDSLGVAPDCSVPPPAMTVQRARVAPATDGESVIFNTAEHPSTSRGGS